MSAKRLRFCMVTTFYPPYHFGGDAIAIQRLSRALVRRGHAVTVVHDVDAYHALSAKTVVPDELVDDGVELVRLESSIPRLSTLLTQQLGRPVVHRAALRRILDGGHHDVVNFHNVSLVGGAGILGMGRDAVRVYMAHEHWLVCPTHVLWRHQREVCTGRECLRCQLRYRRPPQLWRYAGTLGRALRHVDAFIAMSEFSREKHREFGFPREMEVLPPLLGPLAVAAAGETSPHPRPYFLSAGRLEALKGIDDVIRCSANYVDADVLIAGSGSDEQALRTLAAGNPRVHFLGMVTPDALERYQRHALAFLMPSRCYETFGLGVVEAFRQGTPAIARRIGPFPEIVQQGQGGLLFSTAEELRAAMHRIQWEPGVRAALSAAGVRAFAERWTDDVVIPAYLRIIERAAAGRARARGIDPARFGNVP